MWVVGFTLLIDGLDQYIVRGDSNQLKAAFHVNDVDIAILFSAFILVNGIATLPSGYLADRWNRTKAMAVTIVAWSVISAVGGLVPTSAFLLLVLIRGTLGFGQAITDPSGSSVIADFYGDREARQGVLHPAVPQLRRARRGPRDRRRARPALPRPGLARGVLRLHHPRARRGVDVLAPARAAAAARPTGRT